VSVSPPALTIALGSVGIPQTDVVEALVHLGATKEVSSWELRLQNWDGKYSPSGPYPLAVGQDGYICIGRGANVPQIITTRTESISYQVTPTENYVKVSGRCWGEKLFRRVVTKTYSAQKGEAIVKDLLDYFSGINHVRGSTELVENTDTTYTDLEYSDSPVWDILKYIAQSADKAGIIGYDFRVAPDGRFEFFPMYSKTNPTDLTDRIEQIEHRTDITRVRNKITIYGLADKSVPTDKVSWTRSLTPSDGVWQRDTGTISVDSMGAPDGGACIKNAVGSNYWGGCYFQLNAGKEVNCELYPLLDFQAKLADTYSGTGLIILFDAASRSASKKISVSPGDSQFHGVEVGVGSAYANQWDYIQSGFNWTQVKTVRFTWYFSQGVDSGDFWLHGLYFGGRRYLSVLEDTASQAAYGLREYSETDEELWSDNECTLRARALLNYLKSPAVYLIVTSTLIDYGNTPILAADKMYVPFIAAYFRVDSIEYHVDAETQTLELTINFEKEPPQLADYLYGLRTFTVNVEKLSRTKLGRRGIPISTGAGGGSASSIFASNVEIDKTSPCLNLLTSRTLKAAFGFDGANVFIVTYAGDLILYSANHLIRPITDGSDDLGNGTFRFGSAYLKNNLYVAGWEVVANTGRINMSSMPQDAAGTVLEAQGVGFWPMYVNPNGRYSPAWHENHYNLWPAGGSGTGYCGSTSNYWACVAGDSVWYNALGHMDMIDDLAAIKKIQRSERTDKKGVPLIDANSLPEEVRSEEGMIHAGHLMGLALGAIKQLNAKVEELAQRLEAYDKRETEHE
jgi:hypothetical protein